MHNANTHVELPTSAQLLKSTLTAIAVAAALLVTVVLPSEYAIDPTGVGRLLGLTQMGEIKEVLGRAAEADAALAAKAEAALAAGAEPTFIGAAPEATAPAIAKAVDVAKPAAVEAPAAAEQQAAVTQPPALPAPDPVAVAPAGAAASSDGEQIALAPAVPGTRQDEISVVLEPNEGVEYKMEMSAGAATQFEWRVEGGVVNFDMHGTPGSGPETSYLKGRGANSGTGTLTAGFDGNHGWFWRNRGTDSVTITLRTDGAYKNLHRVTK